MRKAIEPTTDQGYACDVCGGTDNVKVFTVETTEVIDTASWCFKCGKEAIEVLSKAFTSGDTGVPTWLRMMDKLSQRPKVTEGIDQ